MNPLEASRYAEELWSRYAPVISPIVDVLLPADLEDRFKKFFDSLSLQELPTGYPTGS
jgi:hypothetical protein